VLFYCLANVAFSQDREVGGGIGALSYTGDLIRTYDITSNRPAGYFFIRRKFRDHVFMRYALTGGNIQGSDDDPIDVLAQQRDAEFNVFVVEASAVLEYYFLDFWNPKTQISWSPYFFIGAGVFRVFGSDEIDEEYSNFQPAIPFGVGVKYGLNRRFNVGFEFGARKLFFDFLDNISDGDPRVRNFQFGNGNDTDWYYFAGFNISYIIYSIPCLFNYN